MFLFLSSGTTVVVQFLPRSVNVQLSYVINAYLLTLRLTPECMIQHTAVVESFFFCRLWFDGIGTSSDLHSSCVANF